MLEKKGSFQWMNNSVGPRGGLGGAGGSASNLKNALARSGSEKDMVGGYYKHSDYAETPSNFKSPKWEI